jgi:hypothetical protein
MPVRLNMHTQVLVLYSVESICVNVCVCMCFCAIEYLRACVPVRMVDPTRMRGLVCVFLSDVLCSFSNFERFFLCLCAPGLFSSISWKQGFDKDRESLTSF